MNILEVININKTYPKFKLNNVSFEIEEGSICGFIGRNGAGKTTTIKSIMGLLHLDSGTIKTFGRDMHENELENRAELAFSMAELDYFTETKIGKLTEVTKRFYKDWNDETYNKVCKMFDLDQSKRIKELSSGMKVKYSLAVALSHNAKLLILDEPTSGLDPVSRDEILEIFKSLVKSGQRSILFSTHITSDLDKCADHIVYIRKGEIVANKTKERFINSYRYVEGKIEDIDLIKDILISYKEEKGNFTGLVYADKIENIHRRFETSIPDLDTIMVYEERKDSQDEEFTF